VSNSGSFVPDSFRDKNGILSLNTSQQLSLARDHLQLLSQPAPAPIADIALDRTSVPPPRRASAAANFQLSSALNDPFSESEVALAVAKLRVSAATGPDSIPPALIRQAGDSFVSSICSLVNDSFASGCLPLSWLTGHVSLLHKKGDTQEVANYRPITVLNALSKVFENLILARLEPYIESSCFLSDTQFGFRRGRGCADNHFLLSEIMAHSHESGHPVFVGFIDISSAYDSVYTEGLWQALENASIHGRMLNVLKVMTSVIIRRVKIRGELSEPFFPARGVPQGGILSPLLFALSFDSLLRELTDSNLGVSIAGFLISNLAFADDVVLTALSAPNLNALFHIVHRHSVQWRYSVNAKKCAVAVFGRPSQVSLARSQHFHIGGDEVVFDCDYPYLGVEVSALNGRPASLVDRRVRAARAKHPLISGPLGGRFCGIPVPLAIRLWNTVVRPSLEWGAETVVLPKHLLHKLDACLGAFLRTAVGTDSFTSTDFLLYELGVQSVSSRRDELQLRFLKHLCTSVSPLVSSVFRSRCAQVRRGMASRSLCHHFHLLLQKYDLLSVWNALPRDSADPLWHRWDQRVHAAVLRADLELRASQLRLKPNLTIYCSLKPLNARTFPSYLLRHGLGQWVKLRLRSSSLQLLSVLGRYVKPPLNPDQMMCLMCGLAVEDPAHFLCQCPSLLSERLAFIETVRSDSGLAALPTAVVAVDSLASWDPSLCVPILLRSCEDPCDSRRAASPSMLLAAALEPFIIKYLSAIWLRRASVLGYVPSISVQDRLSASVPLPDGRSRSFAVGRSKL
jgi:hypothetical protein